MIESVTQNLGLMQIQLEEGDLRTVPEAIQVVIGYLLEVASAGDDRAWLYAAMLAGIEVSLEEFAGLLAKSPGLVELCKRAHPEPFPGYLRIEDLGYVPPEGSTRD
jgi:hypothetical protein